MSDIKIEAKTKQEFLHALQQYFDDELDRELGQFEAEFLCDFILKQLGPVIYNQALYDAETLIKNKIEDTFSEIEKV